MDEELAAYLVGGCTLEPSPTEAVLRKQVVGHRQGSVETGARGVNLVVPLFPD